MKGRPGARGLLVGMGLLATIYSIFLYGISKTELHYVCAWCMRLYVVNISVLVLSLLGGKPERPDQGTLVLAGGAFLALNLIAVGGERGYRSSLSGSVGGPALSAVVAEKAETRGKDPTGPAPQRTFNVKTEDDNDTTFSLDPDDAWTGNPDARVSVVMFGDLECGYCKRTSAELARLEATYSDRVLFVFKHFPMDPTCNPGVKNRMHRYACEAAKASVCAQKQGVFWAFHDLAYKNQHQLGDDYLETYALNVGADKAAYEACMATDEPLGIVRQDAEVGASLDIHGTPRVYINGKLYRSGTSAEVMARAIELALGSTAADAAKAAASLREKADNRGAIPADVPAQREVALGALKFKIDTFEAGITDGAATVGKHQVPAFFVSWFDAKSACEKAGKRLCTEAEWVSTCQNAVAVDDNNNGELADDMIEGTAYPYGDYHEDRRCWDDQDDDKHRPVYTGELPGCVTPSGVYDMAGNVEEWVGDSPETAVLLGGAWDTPDDHARCYRRNDTFGAGYASPRTGFRCCSN